MWPPPWPGDWSTLAPMIKPVPGSESGPLAGRTVGAAGTAPAVECGRRLLESLGATVAPRPRGPVLGVLDASTDQDPGPQAPTGPRPRGRQLPADQDHSAERTVVRVNPTSAAADWARSGAMALTGPADGPPALAPGAPASALAGALAVFDLLTRAGARGDEDALRLPGVRLLGPRLLGERAALAEKAGPLVRRRCLPCPARGGRLARPVARPAGRHRSAAGAGRQ